jgi:uncharacterized protein YigA (DUF484 family)
MQVDNDEFRPEIVRAVAYIEYQIEDLRQKERELETKRQQAKNATNNNGRLPRSPYAKR